MLGLDSLQRAPSVSKVQHIPTTHAATQWHIAEQVDASFAPGTGPSISSSGSPLEPPEAKHSLSIDLECVLQVPVGQTQRQCPNWMQLKQSWRQATLPYSRALPSWWRCLPCRQLPRACSR